MKNKYTLLLLSFFVIILFSGFISSFEWDNFKNYDEETKTITIRNGLTFGTKISEIELKTPLNYLVPRGYQKVAEFEVRNFKDYNNALKELELYNKKKGDEFTEDNKFIRNYDFKYLTYENISVNDYGIILTKYLKNGTGVHTRGIIGNHIEQKEKWNDLILDDFKENDILTIGIFIEVQKGDYVEWIPNFFGVRIDEWASWGEIINITQAHGKTIASAAPQTNNFGMKFFTNSTNLILTSLEVVSGVGSNTARLTHDNGTVIATVSISGGIAIFPSNATLDNATTYRVETSGGSGNPRRFNDPFGATVQNSHILWSGGSFEGGDDVSSNNVKSINLTLDSTEGNLTLNSPINAFSTTNPTITFNGSVFTGDNVLLNVSLILDGVLNETNTSGLNNSNYVFTKVLADGNYNWTYEACDTTDICINETIRNFTIDRNVPIISVTSPIGIIDFGNGTETLNWTVSDDNLDTCFYDYNFTNTTVTCSLNTTTFTLTNQRNLTFWANDTSGNLISNFTTWSYIVFENSQTFNPFTFETKSEEFIINITTNSSTPSSASLIYNGTDEGSATITSLGDNNFNISQTIDIPTGTGNNTWFFNITIDSILRGSFSHQQSVVGINLTVCQASPQDIPYLNFSFKNETTNQEDVTASITTSVWTYFLGTGLVNKTLNYANTTEAFNYAFCFNPSNQTLSTTLDIQYTNTESQQRIFSSVFSTLTNVTTQQTLFLLPTTLGLFSQFFTQNTVGNTLIGVLAVITRTLGGSTITVTSDTTDGSGLVVFFLNPDVTYTATFSLTGFLDNVFTFVAITDLRTVTMGSVTTTVVNGSTISLGTSYEIQPSNESLNNNTIITFSFNVTSGETITLISMNITNSTTQRLFVSNVGQGFISGTVNTDNNTKLFGEFIIQTANETITIKRIWFVGIEFVGDYSLFRQLTLFNDYGFNEFIKFLIVLSVITGLLIFMSGDNQIEDEIKMGVITLVVWGFSIVRWLDTGVVVGSTTTNINALTQFSNQYGIAILTTAGATYFMLRRIFREI